MKRLFLSLFAGVFAVSAHAADTRSVEDLNALSNGSVTFERVNVDNQEKLVATIHEKKNGADIETFILRDKVDVDSVVLEREFSVGVASTVAVPFAATLDKVHGGCLARLDSMTHDANGVIAGVAATYEWQQVYAFNPYFVNMESSKLTFGAVSLSAKMDTEASVRELPNSNEWVFIAVVQKKSWEKDGPNNGELGRVYGFAASNAASSSGKELHVGDFVRAKDYVFVRPMRSFLFYKTGSSYAKPAASLAKTAETASIDELPERLTVTIYEPDDSGDLTSVRKSVKMPTDLGIVNRWHDVLGRGMNHKPSAQGSYINNHTPIIVK